MFFLMTIDGYEVNIGNIWYHKKIESDIPSSTFVIRILIENNRIIKHLEKIIESSIKDKNFEEKAKTHDNSFYNIVEYIKRFLIKSGDVKKGEIKWVANSISEVKINSKFLIIKGEVRKYISK